jgi:hypothetical protein
MRIGSESSNDAILHWLFVFIMQQFSSSQGEGAVAIFGWDYIFDLRLTTHDGSSKFG